MYGIDGQGEIVKKMAWTDTMKAVGAEIKGDRAQVKTSDEMMFQGAKGPPFKVEGKEGYFLKKDGTLGDYTAAIGWGPAAYNRMIELYRMPVFRVGEVALAGAVLFHALNGVRIIILDFWPETMTAEKKLFAGVVTLFAVVYLPMAIYMLRFLAH